MARQIVGQLRQAHLQQLGLQPREKSLQGLARRAPLFDLCRHRFALLAIGHQRLEPRHLGLRFQHRLMGAVQVVKVGDQLLQARCHIERLQHVAAHKIGQIAHRFQRHGLVEQFQRLVVLDAEVAAEQRPVRRERVLHRDAAAAQPFAQLGRVGTKVRKVLGNPQRPVGHDVHAQRLALRVFQPEHLGQGDGLVIAGVVKHAQDDRITVRPTQRHRPARTAALLIALGLVMAQHIAAQAALPGIGPGRLVVGHAVRGHEQGGHGIDQG